MKTTKTEDSVNIDKQAEDVAMALRGYVLCPSCSSGKPNWRGGGESTASYKRLMAIMTEEQKEHLKKLVCPICHGQRYVRPEDAKGVIEARRVCRREDTSTYEE